MVAVFLCVIGVTFRLGFDFLASKKCYLVMMCAVACIYCSIKRRGMKEIHHCAYLAKRRERIMTHKYFLFVLATIFIVKNILKNIKYVN